MRDERQGAAIADRTAEGMSRLDWVAEEMSRPAGTELAAALAADPVWAEERAFMETLLGRLAALGDEMPVSADFHPTLMTRLLAEPRETGAAAAWAPEEDLLSGQAAAAGKGAVSVTGEIEAGALPGKKRAWAPRWRWLEFLRRRPALAGAVGACCVLLVVFAGGQLARVASGRYAYSGARALVEYVSDMAGQSTSASSPMMGSGGSAMPAASPPRVNAVADTSYDMSMEMAEADSGGYSAYDEGMGTLKAAGLAAGVGESAISGALGDDAGVAREPAPAPAAASAPVQQKIIRTGNLTLEVEKYDAALIAIKSIVTAAGGYVTGESSYLIDGKERKAGGVDLRIPYDRYEQAVEQAGELGKVLEQSVNAQDVTSQFVDLTARIRVMETKQERLLVLLEQSGRLEDMLAVENELASTNGELESLKGQMRYLSDRTDYSSLYISMSEKAPAAVEIQTTGLAGFGQQLREAFFLGVNGFLRGIGDLAVWLVGSLPGLIIALAVAVFCWLKWLRPFWRARRARRADK
ncbi:MAG: DUF4349 domain-containing protein [Peptococcaceae bacterium]|jgi:hypothetical protein|nr:DUF4349 domain-containing protein [Peptococcaceae bacterium]